MDNTHNPKKNNLYKDNKKGKDKAQGDKSKHKCYKKDNNYFSFCHKKTSFHFFRSLLCKFLHFFNYSINFFVINQSKKKCVFSLLYYKNSVKIKKRGSGFSTACICSLFLYVQIRKIIHIWFPCSIFRRDRDSNPGFPCGEHPRSRRARSTAPASLQSIEECNRYFILYVFF